MIIYFLKGVIYKENYDILYLDSGLVWSMLRIRINVKKLCWVGEIFYLITKFVMPNLSLFIFLCIKMFETGI